MDALTRFNSGRSRPPAAPADEDAEWDAVIARAKMRAASLRAPLRLPAAPAGSTPPELQETPPPIPLARVRAMATPVAPRTRVPERTRATLDALMRGGLHSAASLRPAFAARRLAEEDVITPAPVATPRWATAGPPPRRTKRP